MKNHTPEVIVIDEIGTAKEAAAAKVIAEKGVVLVSLACGPPCAARSLPGRTAQSGLLPKAGGLCSRRLQQGAVVARSERGVVLLSRIACSAELAVPAPIEQLRPLAHPDPATGCAGRHCPRHLPAEPPEESRAEPPGRRSHPGHRRRRRGQEGAQQVSRRAVQGALLHLLSMLRPAASGLLRGMHARHEDRAPEP